MNKFLLLTAFVLISITSVASADNRILSCKNKIGEVVFEICGVRGCVTTVTIGKKITKYNLKRVKNSDGSLKYTARVGSSACNVGISALRQGIRRLTAISCASKLKDSTCKFIIPGLTSSSSEASLGSSSSNSSSRSSSSSSSEDSSDDSHSSSRSSRS